MEDNNFWGRLIRKLREEQKVSQRVLAARAKVNRSTLRRIETGETSGDIEIMERLLGYLGYELEALERSSLEERLRQQAEMEHNPDRRSQLAASRILSLSMMS
ncbi:helix-turn-helix domain-containing protein [Sinorhizobium fredii]|uniref:helix-turn-helix domain-containing protein n=1 Tax=Rhizobium fredii TaxID=380 RepID=UPI0018659664|nr:helix-turn-helix transcriptional regulator [Sinorhizobium fredii]